MPTDQVCFAKEGPNRAPGILPPPVEKLCQEKLNGDPQTWQALCEQLVTGMRTANFSHHDRFAVQLALAEAVSNALRHGNGSDPRKYVQVAFAVDGPRVWIRVEDEGHGFAIDRVPNPTLAENLDRTCGRGLFLIRSYMDLVEHNSRGNVVTMVKFRSGT
jgi:serine/threonine-protein kinase RsbW